MGIRLVYPARTLNTLGSQIQNHTRHALLGNRLDLDSGHKHLGAEGEARGTQQTS